MKSLFAYGSLQLPEVVRAVLGVALEGIPAQLPGYRRCRIRDRSFPGVRPETNGNCPGILYRRIGVAHWRLLDAFEDDFYRRCSLPVQLADGGCEIAEVYVVGEESRGILLDEPWDLEQFRAQYLQRFLRDHA